MACGASLLPQAGVDLFDRSVGRTEIAEDEARVGERGEWLGLKTTGSAGDVIGRHDKVTTAGVAHRNDVWRTAPATIHEL